MKAVGINLKWIKKPCYVYDVRIQYTSNGDNDNLAVGEKNLLMIG